MADSDLYEAQFIWPHTEPNSVIVTGTFDDWSASIHLTKTASGFEGTTKIPWGQKIKYKFVVDGQWVTHEDQPTETDPGGFVNNVFTAPPKPAEPEPAPATEDPVALETPVKEAEVPVTNGHATNGHTVATEVTEDRPAEPAALEEAAASGPEDKEGENNTSAAPNVEPKHPAGYPRLLSDLADTIAARDGTSSALDYVASGLGAVVHSVVGVDPINAQKIAIPTPKPDDAFDLPAGQESVPNTAELPPEPAQPTTPESPPPIIAPIVPIMVEPVNAAENNTQPAASPAIPVVEEGSPEPSTHVPAIGGTPKEEPKPESAAEEAPSEAPAQNVDKETPVAATEDIAAAEPTGDKPSGAITLVPEPTVAEPSAEEPAVSLPPAAPEAPADKAEESSAPEPPVEAIKASDPEVVPPIEEVVPEPKKETDEELKESAVEAPAEEKPAEISPAEAALVAAPPADVVPVTAEEPAPTSSAQESSTEVKPEEAGLAVVVPPSKEVAVAEAASEAQPAAAPTTEESKDEPVTAVSNDVDAQPATAPEAEAEQEGAPPPQKEAAESPAQPAPEPAVEPSPAQQETPVVKPEAAPAPAPEKPAATEASSPPKSDQAFPSTSETPVTGSPSSSKFNSTRKKRTSIFGKLKNIFHHDKEKEGGK